MSLKNANGIYWKFSEQINNNAESLKFLLVSRILFTKKWTVQAKPETVPEQF